MFYWHYSTLLSLNCSGPAVSVNPVANKSHQQKPLGGVNWKSSAASSKHHNPEVDGRIGLQTIGYVMFTDCKYNDVPACHLHGRLISLQLNWHHGLWVLPSENLQNVKPSRPEGPWRLIGLNIAPWTPVSPVTYCIACPAASSPGAWAGPGCSLHNQHGNPESPYLLITPKQPNRHTHIQGWAKKSKPDNFCNNFVYCQPISIIFGTYKL